jgi:methylaspartate mutase E subunit/methylaspartate mutase S subunit
MSSNKGHTILLGGIGGDSHSVGLTILRQALTTQGYRVRYLGTQNRLEEFFRFAAFCNAVMISSMDGHTRYYLHGFPELYRQFQPQGTRWYLGGNLHIGDAVGYEALFREMGFDRVFVNFVDVNTVLQLLARDLEGTNPAPDWSALWKQSQTRTLQPAYALSDDLLDQESFESSRRDVLETWATGAEASDLVENAAFLVQQPSLPALQKSVGVGGPLIQPRCGVTFVSEQLRLFQAFKSAGAQVLSYQVDSLTRNNNYAGADEAIREGSATGLMTLNGFPVINHGVAGLRRIISEIKVPLQTRHSTRDPRLLAEISYAGGVTGFEGGAICYNIPYYKDYPLRHSIKTWQYVDRLTGHYYEAFGIVLDREFFGTLTATLIPPSLGIVVNLIEAILAVQQGVKCVSLGYAEQGNRVQDIAAIRTLKSMAHEILQGMGHRNIQVNTVFQQYMAAFPGDAARAEQLIYNSAITASLSGATRVIVKTPVEALKIPTLRDNVHSLDLVRRGIRDAASYNVDEAQVADECSIIRREVQANIDAIIMSGGGCIAEGVVNAFDRGILDVPFSPSLHNRHEVMTARDVDGAVRYLSCGNLPFDRELREFHASKMAERRRAEGLLEKENYLLVERDVMSIPRGEYECWPLDARPTPAPQEALVLTTNA